MEIILNGLLKEKSADDNSSHKDMALDLLLNESTVLIGVEVSAGRFKKLET